MWISLLALVLTQGLSQVAGPPYVEPEPVTELEAIPAEQVTLSPGFWPGQLERAALRRASNEWVPPGPESRANEPGQLPVAAAHNETCAALARAHSLQAAELATGDARAFKESARALHNGVLAGLGGETQRPTWRACPCRAVDLEGGLVPVAGLIFAEAEPAGALPILAVLQRIPAETTWRVDPTDRAKAIEVHVRQFGGLLSTDPASDPRVEIETTGPVGFRLRVRCESSRPAVLTGEGPEILELVAPHNGWVEVTRIWEGCVTLRTPKAEVHYPCGPQKTLGFGLGPFTYAAEQLAPGATNRELAPAYSSGYRVFGARVDWDQTNSSLPSLTTPVRRLTARGYIEPLQLHLTPAFHHEPSSRVIWFQEGT